MIRFLRIDRWVWPWFPNLNRLDTEAERWELWRAAYYPVGRSPAYIGTAIAIQVAAQIVLGIPVARYARSHGYYNTWAQWGIPTVIAALAVLGLASSLPAWADDFGEYRPWTGRLNLGWTIPAGAIEPWITDGFAFGGGFGYNIPNKPIGFRVDFFWSWHDLSNKAIQEILEHTDKLGYANTRVSYVTGDIMLRTRRRGPLQLYFQGGIGAYNRFIELGDIVGWVNDPWYPWWGYYPIYGSYFSDSKVAFGYNIGGGIDLQLAPGQGSLFLEAGYHYTTHDPSPIEIVP